MIISAVSPFKRSLNTPVSVYTFISAQRSSHGNVFVILTITLRCIFFPSVLQSFAVAVQCCTLALAVRTASCRTILVHPSHVLMVCVCQIIKGTSATALHKLLETGETHTAKLLKSHLHIMSLVKVLRSLIILH